MKSKYIKFILILSALLILSAGCNQSPSYDHATDDTGLEQQRQPASPDASRGGQIQVRQIVQGEFGDKLFNFYADENKNAIDLLKTSFPVEVTGDVVLSINKVKPDKKHYWEFFLNHQRANVDPRFYKPVNGDVLEWKQSLDIPNK